MTNPNRLLQKARDLKATGDFEAASRACAKALTHGADQPDAMALLGAIKAQQGNFDEAESLLRRALRKRPKNPGIWSNLGGVLQSRGRLADAILAYKTALSLSPEMPEAYGNLGHALLAQGDETGAVLCLRRAVELRSDQPQSHYNLGTALLKLGDLAGAREALERSIVLRPDFAEAYSNLGHVLKAAGLHELALKAWEDALEIAPEHATARWNRALHRLAAGDLAGGWDEYHWGFPSGNRERRPFPHRPWNGACPPGLRILVYGEQGVGDEVMFASCLPDLAARGLTVTLECDSRLAPLFARSFPEISVEGASRTSPPAALLAPEAFDAQIPCADLPCLFRRTLGAFPPGKKYLRADPDRVRSWSQRLKDLGAGIKVGVSWRGGAKPETRRQRSIPLPSWGPILSAHGAHFIDLQYGDTDIEREKFSRGSGIAIHRWADVDPLTDIDGLSALISALDLVISIDNSTVHLAGGLGVPCWVLLAIPADWRWGYEGDESLWYPGMRLLRQKTPGRWAEVIQHAASELNALSAQAQGFPPDKTSQPLSSREVPRDTVHQPGRQGAASAARDAVARTRAVLLNDTTDWYHWGCTCTSSAIRSEVEELGVETLSVPIWEMLQTAPTPETLSDFDNPAFLKRYRAANDYLLKRIENADFVVVNGEGTLHGVGRPAVNLLYLAYTSARHLGLPVHIINHSCYPNDSQSAPPDPVAALYRRAYEAACFVAVREPASQEVVRSLGISSIQAFDCLPLYVRRTARPPVERPGNVAVVSGSVAWQAEGISALASLMQHLSGQGFRLKVLVGAKANPAADDRTFVETLARAAPQGWTLVQARSAAEWLTTIAEASVLVSGRFHHSIAAACYGTPFVALGSNTPKIRSLCQILGRAEPLGYGTPDLASQLRDHTEAVLQAGPSDPEPLFSRLCQLSQQNFLGLRYQLGVDEDSAPSAGIKALPHAAWNELTLLGKRAAEEGRHEEALRILDRARQADPAAGEPVLLSAAVFLALDRVQEAVDAASQVALHHPALAGAALILIGDGYKRLGALDAATAAYEGAARRTGRERTLGQARLEELRNDAGVPQVGDALVEKKGES